MVCWKDACTSEKLQFQAISKLMELRPHLLDFLFSIEEPRLSAPPDTLLQQAMGLCSSDYLLVRLGVELWCGQAQVAIYELYDLEPELFACALQAIDILAPKLTVQLEFLNSLGVNAGSPR
jgi:hypothetical protein